LKEDEEIRSNLDILKMTDLNSFVDDYLFSDLFFLYRLEVFLIQKNGNTKNQKTAFFKEEILKILEFKMIDVLFDKKMKNVNTALDNHYKVLEAFNVID
jgi:hypothetical protein